MTSEDRLDRIEHITVGLVEERRKDREEYRQLWRDTQRQINDLTLKIADTNDAVARLTANLDRLTEETRASDKRARDAEQELRDRIQALVSGIGTLLTQQKPQ